MTKQSDKFDHIILIVMMILGVVLLVFFSDIEANQLKKTIWTSL